MNEWTKTWPWNKQRQNIKIRHTRSCCVTRVIHWKYSLFIKTNSFTDTLRHTHARTHPTKDEVYEFINEFSAKKGRAMIIIPLCDGKTAAATQRMCVCVFTLKSMILTNSLLSLSLLLIGRCIWFEPPIFAVCYLLEHLLLLSIVRCLSEFCFLFFHRVWFWQRQRRWRRALSLSFLSFQIIHWIFTLLNSHLLFGSHQLSACINKMFAYSNFSSFSSYSLLLFHSLTILSLWLVHFAVFILWALIVKHSEYQKKKRSSKKKKIRQKFYTCHTFWNAWEINH